MTIFVAGATGAIGPRLVPALLERGYAVAAMARRPEAAEELRRTGAVPVVADALDREAVMRAFAATNELRTRGTDNLLRAARTSGTRLFVGPELRRPDLRSHQPGTQDGSGRHRPEPPRKQRGTSNEKAKRELGCAGWAPVYARGVPERVGRTGTTP